MSERTLDKTEPRFVHGREVEFMAEAHGWVMVRRMDGGQPYTMTLLEWLRFPDLETGRQRWAEFHRAIFAESSPAEEGRKP